MKKNLTPALESMLLVILISSILVNVCHYYYFSSKSNNALAQAATRQTVQPAGKNMTNVLPQTKSTHIQSLPIFPYFMFPQQQKQHTSGFMLSGTINSLIHAPKAQWIATGNWRMTVDNGSLKYFETNMTWFNSNGTSSHTHEFRNLNVGGKVITILQAGNSVSLKGVMDVGTNHHIVWRNVPTTIDIHGGKTIIISVDDKATNHHFAGQPILGVVTLFVRNLS
jgi:hypothetical protein